MRRVTCEAWAVEGKARFGEDMVLWRFVCPNCKRVTSVQEWVDAGAPENAVAYSCVGRWKAGTGCDYAGGGLFRLNPVHVAMPDGLIRETFEWAEAEKCCPNCGGSGRLADDDSDVHSESYICPVCGGKGKSARPDSSSGGRRI